MSHFASALYMKDQPREIFILSRDRSLLDEIESTSMIGSAVHLVDEIELASRLDETGSMPHLLVIDRQHVTSSAPESGCELLSMICVNYPSMAVMMLPSLVDTTNGESEGRAAAIAMLRKLLAGRTPMFFNRSNLRSSDLEKNEIEIDADTSFVRSSAKMRTIESQCQLVAQTSCG